MMASQRGAFMALKKGHRQALRMRMPKIHLGHTTKKTPHSNRQKITKHRTD